MSDLNDRSIVVPNLRIFAVFAVASFFTLFLSPHFAVGAWLKVSLLAGFSYMLFGFVLGFPIRALTGPIKNPGLAYVTALVLVSSLTAFAVVFSANIATITVAYAVLDSLFFAAVWTIGNAFGVCPQIKTFLPEKVS